MSTGAELSVTFMAGTLRSKANLRSSVILVSVVNHPDTRKLTIGEVAERTGVAVSAVRFYDAQGFISSTRSEGGQRRYAREVLRRIAFIRAAQTIGLTLEEIQNALATLPLGRTPTKADWAKLS